MDKQPDGDIELTCISCRMNFLFSPGEQKFFTKMGFRPPKRWNRCRGKRLEQGRLVASARFGNRDDWAV